MIHHAHASFAGTGLIADGDCTLYEAGDNPPRVFPPLAYTCSTYRSMTLHILAHFSQILLLPCCRRRKFTHQLITPYPHGTAAQRPGQGLTETGGGGGNETENSAMNYIPLLDRRRVSFDFGAIILTEPTV